MRGRLAIGSVGAVAAAAVMTGVVAACGGPSAPAPPTSPAAPRTTASSGAAVTGPAAYTLKVRTLPLRLPAAFGREAVISQGRYAVVAGGMVAGDSSTASAYRLDLRRLRTTPLPSMPVPVHDTAGAAAGHTPLVIGGGNASEQSVVQAWDGTTWKVISHLPQARSDLVAASVGGRIVVLGGYNGSRPAEPDILATTDGRSWTTIGTLPLPVRYAASTVADGAIWLFGGERSGAEQTAIQRVDPATGQAKIVGHLSGPLGHAVAMTIGNRILIAGGRTSSTASTDRMWWYDPATGALTSAGRLPVALTDSAVATRGSRHFLIGGEAPGVTDRVIEISTP